MGIRANLKFWGLNYYIGNTQNMQLKKIAIW